MHIYMHQCMYDGMRMLNIFMLLMSIMTMLLMHLVIMMSMMMLIYRRLLQAGLSFPDPYLLTLLSFPRMQFPFFHLSLSLRTWRIATSTSSNKMAPVALLTLPRPSDVGARRLYWCIYGQASFQCPTPALSRPASGRLMTSWLPVFYPFTTPLSRPTIWLVGHLSVWLAGWLIDCLDYWLTGWLACWLANWVVGNSLSTSFIGCFCYTNGENSLVRISDRGWWCNVCFSAEFLWVKRIPEVIVRG